VSAPLSGFSYEIRPAHEDEVGEIVDLMNACSLVEIGVPDTSREDLLRWWRRPTFDPSCDAWVAEAGDGRLVGAIEVVVEAGEGDLRIDGYTHPDYLGRGIGSRLADAAERRAISIATERGLRLPVEVLHGVWSGTEGSRFLEARGYERTRCFIRMRAQMNEPPSEPVWPAGILVAGFERGRDEPLFHASLEEAFQDHWRWTATPLDEWVQLMIEHNEAFDGSLWFRAMDGDQVAGAIIARPRTVEDPDAGWIEDLAVRRPWRRRGIGLALLQHTFGALYRRGLRAALLGVDAESPTGATRLYERAGMREVRRIDVYGKTFT
jgi:mycothiol synthase